CALGSRGGRASRGSILSRLAARLNGIDRRLSRSALAPRCCARGVVLPFRRSDSWCGTPGLPVSGLRGVFSRHRALLRPLERNQERVYSDRHLPIREWAILIGDPDLREIRREILEGEGPDPFDIRDRALSN